MNALQLDAFARRHHGLVTLAAFVTCGATKRTWYRWIEAGRLISIHPGVARLPGVPVTKEMTIAAAVLAARERWPRTDRPPTWPGFHAPADDPVDVMFGRDRRTVDLDGVVIHRPRDPIDLRSVTVHGIECTVMMRWLVDIGAMDPDGVSPAIGHMVTSGRVSAKALRWAGHAHSRQGRTGIVAFRGAVDEWLIGNRLPDSVLEKAMNELCHAYGLPPMTFHAVLVGYEVDFHIDGTPIVLECDSWEFHDKARRDFERDRKKKADLAAAGYVVVPFTYRNVINRPAWVASTIRRAVERWSPGIA